MDTYHNNSATPVSAIQIYFNIALENDNNSYKYDSLTGLNSSIFLQEARFTPSPTPLPPALAGRLNSPISTGRT